MFISFIVPVHNVEQYLEDCISTLRKQDIPKTEYEIICVDDGSTDGSYRILSVLAETGEIRVFRQKHKGVSAARNLGLLEAKGEYIWFVDADDFINPSSVKKLMLAAESSPDVISFGAYMFYDALSEEEKTQREAGVLPPSFWMTTVTVWSSVFRRDYLLHNKMYFREDMVLGEDTLFLYELSLHSPKKAEVKDTLYCWRRRSGSTTIDINNSWEKRNSLMILILSMKDYYFSGNGDLEQCADKMMSNLWWYLFECTKLDRKEFHAGVRQAKEAGLFPARRPKECTLKRSYMTQRTDLFGKVFDYLYMHLHRPWGLMLMRLYHVLRAR